MDNREGCVVIDTALVGYGDGGVYSVSSGGRMGMAPFLVQTKAEVWTARE